MKKIAYVISTLLKTLLPVRRPTNDSVGAFDPYDPSNFANQENILVICPKKLMIRNLECILEEIFIEQYFVFENVSLKFMSNGVSWIL